MNNEKFEYYLQNYWLFNDEFRNSKLYEEAGKFPADAFVEPVGRQIQLIPFDNWIISLEKEQIIRVLSWLKYQYQMLATTEANKDIINFVDAVGQRLAIILSIKEQNKKQG